MGRPAMPGSLSLPPASAVYLCDESAVQLRRASGVAVDCAVERCSIDDRLQTLVIRLKNLLQGRAVIVANVADPPRGAGMREHVNDTRRFTEVFETNRNLCFSSSRLPWRDGEV